VASVVGDVSTEISDADLMYIPSESGQGDRHADEESEDENHDVIGLWFLLVHCALFYYSGLPMCAYITDVLVSIQNLHFFWS